MDVYERLLEAIKKHSTMEEDEILGAGEHGADAGWPGFSYYSDSIEFYEKNKKDIWELIAEESENSGDTPLEFISKFGGAKDVTDENTFENLLAWYALESIGHYLESRKEGEEELEEEVGD